MVMHEEKRGIFKVKGFVDFAANLKIWVLLARVCALFMRSTPIWSTLTRSTLHGIDCYEINLIKTTLTKSTQLLKSTLLSN